MKFLVTKHIHTNKTFVLLLTFYALLMLLYFVGDLFYLGHFFGSTPEAIRLSILGNPEEFTEPMSLVTLLEQIHIGLFLAILALFSTMAILLRLQLSNAHKSLLVFVGMGALLLSALSLLATAFVACYFSYLLYGATLLWHGVGIYVLVLVLVQLSMKKL